MYQEDFLLRMIREMFQSVLRWVHGADEAARAEVERGLEGAVGLDLATIDALPAGALAALLSEGDTLAAERMEVVVAVLEGLAQVEGGAKAEARRAKAQVLSDALDRIRPTLS